MDDKKKAKHLLRQMGGPQGYDRLVSSAVVADGMMIIQRYINFSQVGPCRVQWVRQVVRQSHRQSGTQTGQTDKPRRTEYTEQSD